ncbi:hypothetical protein BY996DRAFT_8401294, partial [Phakopsora pachyrhizi]
MAPIISKPHQPILRAMLYLTTSTTTLAGSTYLVCSGDASGPRGSSLEAMLHCQKARSWSSLNAPMTVWRTPLLWNRHRSFSF